MSKISSKRPNKTVNFIDFDLEIKQCGKCRKIFSFNNFYKNSKNPNGLISYCKSCHKENYYNLEKQSKRTKKFKNLNKERVRARQRIYQFERRTRIKVSSDGSVTDDFIKSIYALEYCYWCKKFTPREKRTLEHIIELISGGKHSSENITMSCKSCNSARFNKNKKE